MKKKLPLIVLAIVAFAIGMKVSATYAIDRAYYYGYFTNAYDSYGDDVFQNNANDGYSHYNSSSGAYDAIPPAVNSASEFINFVMGKLNSTRVDYSTANNATNWDRTSAAFMIQTMIGTSRNRPPSGSEISDWQNRVYGAANAGLINWNTYVCAAPNTYYQINRSDYSSSVNDDAWYGSTGCGQAIVFYNNSGSAVYIIRRNCANPLGNPSPIQVPWSVVGSTTISDGVPDPGDTATRISTRPGDTVTWGHSLYNQGPGVSSNWIATYGQVHPPVKWTAQYYNNTTLSGSPVLTRQEDEVFYNDSVGSTPPGPGVLADGFSARWTKTVNLAAGGYWFTANEDDGARLYLDGTLILDDWSSHGTTDYSVYRDLAAGNHTIEYQYFEGGGPGHAQLDYTVSYTAGQNYGTLNPGQTGWTFNTSQIIPNGTPPGTRYCQKVLWDWKTSSGGNELFNSSGTGFITPGFGEEACATVVASQNLTPSINVQVNGGSIAGNFAEPGDTVTFTYAVANAGGDSSGTACTIYGLSRNGYYSIPSPYDSTSDAGFTQPAHGCPRNFPGGGASTTLVTETVPAASVAANKSICRSLFVNPASPTVGNLGTEACVYVVSKPYSRVYGGDVSAGGNLVTSPNSPSSCTTNSKAAVIGWNKRSAGSWAGAGVQYAVYALSTIFDTSTTLGNTSGGTPPSGLAFANTSTNTGNGIFGVSMGSAACVQDYYATKPASTIPLPASIGAGLASGDYSAAGNVILGGGTILPGTKVNIYVDGNLLITNSTAPSITYGGSGAWTSGNIPMLRVIVRGNIFIDNDINQLDGLYVAQPNGVSGGIIYTCSITGAPFVPLTLNGSVGSTCAATKLTVNGAFVAKQVELLRTTGTVGKSSAAEANSSANIAEVFNYNPALWMSQPADTSNNAEYDAINSLPPVL